METIQSDNNNDSNVVTKRTFNKYNNNKKEIQFFNVEQEEMNCFTKILQKWIVKYNEEESIDNNDYASFSRFKVFIDISEMIKICPNIVYNVINNFLKFSKYVTSFARKTLSKQTKNKRHEIPIFIDIIIINFPFLIDSINFDNFQHYFSLDDTHKNKVLGFKKLHVIDTKNISNLLWVRRYCYNCSCNSQKYFEKYYSIYNLKSKNDKKLLGSESYFNCYTCHKPCISDKNSELFIRCQEITACINSNDNENINNIIQIYVYGDLINSVNKGDVISLVAFYVPANNNNLYNSYEKDFSYGQFVALNINYFYNRIVYLKESLLTYQCFTKLDNVLALNKNPKYEFCLKNKFNENIELNFIRSSSFNKQLSINFGKLIFENFIYNKNVKLDNNNINSFLKLALDISIIQRDTYNYINKVGFNFNDKIPKNSKNKEFNQMISRSILFKSSIFDQSKAKDESITEMKKYLRLIKHKEIEKNINKETDLLQKPVNLIIIKDFISFEEVFNYSQFYNEIINIYPYIANNGKSNPTKEQIYNYFITVNNTIVIIPDLNMLSKVEIEIINLILNKCSNLEESSSNNNNKLNITFWFCAAYKKLNCVVNKKNKLITDIKGKAFELIFSSCEIILNFSERFNACRGIFNNKNSNNYDCNNNDCNKSKELKAMLLNLEQEMLLETKHKNIKMCKQNHYFNNNSSNNSNNRGGEAEECFDNSFLSVKLLEDYFIAKRSVSNVQFNDLVNYKIYKI